MYSSLAESKPSFSETIAKFISVLKETTRDNEAALLSKADQLDQVYRDLTKTIAIEFKITDAFLNPKATILINDEQLDLLINFGFNGALFYSAYIFALEKNLSDAHPNVDGSRIQPVMVILYEDVVKQFGTTIKLANAFLQRVKNTNRFTNLQLDTLHLLENQYKNLERLVSRNKAGVKKVEDSSTSIMGSLIKSSSLKRKACDLGLQEEAQNHEDKIINLLTCPISGKIMQRPVKIKETGVICDEASFKERLNCGYKTCPGTGRTLISAETELDLDTVGLLEKYDFPVDYSQKAKPPASSLAVESKHTPLKEERPLFRVIKRHPPS